MEKVGRTKYKGRLKIKNHVFRSYNYFVICFWVSLWWSYVLSLKFFVVFCHNGLLCYWISIDLSHYVIIFMQCRWLWNLLTNITMKWRRSKWTYKEEDVRFWYFFKSLICSGGLVNTCIWRLLTNARSK